MKIFYGVYVKSIEDLVSIFSEFFLLVVKK